MAEATIGSNGAVCNEEDYTGAVCLLVRERDKRRHAKTEVLIDADRILDAAPLDWVIRRRAKYERRGKYIVCMSLLPGMQGWVLGLHRFLMDPPEHLVVDHISRQTLDNRSRNLRICTPQQNSFNSTPEKGKGGSKYKGVSRKPGRRTLRNRWPWVARISVDRKPVLIGHFSTEEQAAYAYNLFAEKHRGEYAYLNPVKLAEPDIAAVRREIERIEADRRRRAEWALMPPAPPPPPRFRGPIYAMDLVKLPESFPGE